jgi:acetyl-CoA acyltransferase
MFRQTRPDDLLTHVIRGALDRCPGLDPKDIGDVIIGNAMPEAEQGMNVARIASLLAGLPDSVPGVTVNRFCASGLQAVAWAADRIRIGETDAMIAGGVESMSLIPMGGHSPAMNPRLFDDDHIGIAYGMGITAERVAKQWRIGREDQDRFALSSHQRAVAAIDQAEFQEAILPYTVTQRRPDQDGHDVESIAQTVDRDEGPRRDTSLEALARLKPVFAANGSVTAGNSSQMSDGAAALVLMSEAMMKRLELKPLARLMAYSVVGVAPEVMGIGPREAVPKALDLAGIGLADIDWIELNEAFAAQSLAVIRELDLDSERVNPQGSAIALGHPLGATGAIRTTNLVHGLRRHEKKYGMVTMCVGTGMGAAAVFEALW